MKTYSLTAAAEYLNAGENTVLALVADGIIPAAKIGSNFVFAENHLDAYLLKEIEIQTAERLAAAQAGTKAKVKTAFGRRKAKPVLPDLEAAA